MAQGHKRGMAKENLNGNCNGNCKGKAKGMTTTSGMGKAKETEMGKEKAEERENLTAMGKSRSKGILI